MDGLKFVKSVRSLNTFSLIVQLWRQVLMKALGYAGKQHRAVFVFFLIF